MLRKLYIDNYKSLVNFELPLTELTLLLGANGTGKSSVLDVVFGLRELLRGTAKITDPSAFPRTTLTRWQSRPVQTFEITCELDGVSMVYRLELEHEKACDRARVSIESLKEAGQPLFSFASGEVQLYRDDHSEGPTFRADWTESALARVAETKDNTKLWRFKKFMCELVLCSLQPFVFEAETSREDSALLRDGSNFASWYRHMSSERQDLPPELHETLRGVIEGLQALRPVCRRPPAWSSRPAVWAWEVILRSGAPRN